MKNGKTEHDFDSIAELLRRQSDALDVLLRHVAWAEAIVTALTLKTLSGENLDRAKSMKDYIQPMIYDEMIAEIEDALDEV